MNNYSQLIVDIKREFFCMKKSWYGWKKIPLFLKIEGFHFDFPAWKCREYWRTDRCRPIRRSFYGLLFLVKAPLECIKKFIDRCRQELLYIAYNKNFSDFYLQTGYGKCLWLSQKIELQRYNFGAFAYYSSEQKRFLPATIIKKDVSIAKNK